MDKKKKDGYVTGIVCLVVFGIFLPTTLSVGWNTTGQIFGVFTIVFGVLGVGSLWKPESIGAIVSQFLENLAKSEGESDSHDKQTQKKSSGIQVMSHDQSSVKIVVNSGKKGQIEGEETEILRKEKIEVSPSDSYIYEFEFTKGDHLKGEISSTSRIDIYFLDEFNFDKWNRGRKYFEPENCNEGVLETNIDYEVPKRGTWYLIISARATCLYL